MKKLVVSLLTVMMFLMLACCGGKKEVDATEARKDKEIEATEEGEDKEIEVLFDTVEDSAMVLNISVNPQIEMYMDKEGKVTPYANDELLINPIQIVNDIEAAVAQMEQDLQISFRCKVESVQVVNQTVANSSSAASNSTTVTVPNSTTAPVPTTPTTEDAKEEDVYADGRINEHHYDNGVFTYTKNTMPNGMYLENFYTNGICTKTLEVNNATGVYATYLYDEEGVRVSGSGQRGILTFDETYYKNGQCAVRTTIHPYEGNNKTVEYFDEAGNLQKIDVYDANGQYIKTNYP